MSWVNASVDVCEGCKAESIKQRSWQVYVRAEWHQKTAVGVWLQKQNRLEAILLFKNIIIIWTSFSNYITDLDWNCVLRNVHDPWSGHCEPLILSRTLLSYPIMILSSVDEPGDFGAFQLFCCSCPNFLKMWHKAYVYIYKNTIYIDFEH